MRPGAPQPAGPSQVIINASKTMDSIPSRRPGCRRFVLRRFAAAGLRFTGLVLAWAFAIGQAAAASLTLGSAEAGRGGTGLVAIRFQPDAAPVAAALQLDVRFDPGRLAAGFATAGSGGGGFEVRSASPEPGLARVIVFSGTNRAMPGGELVLLPLRVLAGAPEGSVPLSVSNVVVATAAGVRVEPVSVQGGTLVIRDVSAPRFERPVLGVNGQLVLTLSGREGETYALEASSDLTGWEEVGRAVVTGGVAGFSQATAGVSGARFYRAVQVP